MRELLQKCKEWLKGENGRRTIVIAGLLGMALILLSQFLPESQAVSAPETDYADLLEQRLVALVSSVDGVGECRVMVTLESGTEHVYTAQTALVAEVYPTVRGVVVVCEGGDQPAICDRVIEVVTTALNVSKRRVCVTKLT